MSLMMAVHPNAHLVNALEEAVLLHAQVTVKYRFLAKLAVQDYSLACMVVVMELVILLAQTLIAKLLSAFFAKIMMAVKADFAIIAFAHLHFVQKLHGLAMIFQKNVL